jgi:hypothetical protein
LAVAAVELAEGYQRQGRAIAVVMRWHPVLAIVCFGYLSISAASRGEQWMLIFVPLLVLGSFAHLIFNPGTRPKNMARGLEASRRVVASGL